MKEDQYHALCKACDELLLEPERVVSELLFLGYM